MIRVNIGHCPLLPMIPGLFLRKMWTWEGGRFLAALEITRSVTARPARAEAVSTWVVGDRFAVIAMTDLARALGAALDSPAALCYQWVYKPARA